MSGKGPLPGRTIVAGGVGRNLATAVIDDNKNCIAAMMTTRPACTRENSVVLKIRHEMDSCEKEVPAKKKRLSSEGSMASAAQPDEKTVQSRQLYCADRWNDIRCLNAGYIEHVTELFFLQNGGNLMDYLSWRKRPNKLLACYLNSECLDEGVSCALEG